MNDIVLQRASAQIESMQANLPQVQAFFDSATFTVSYVVHDPASKRAAIIDSVLDYDAASGRSSTTSAQQIVDWVNTHHLQIDWILETHAHADHLSAAPWLQQQLGGQLAIGEHIVEVQETFAGLFNAGDDFKRDGSDFDQLFADGDEFNIGDIPVTVMHVPGHTPACIAFVIGNAVFVGDTLFMPDYGTARADFPGGDARQLYQSLRRVLSLPAATRLFVCHDYLPDNRNYYHWESTVAEQCAENVHANKHVSEDEFVAMRTARDASLAVPNLILPSVQINMRAGHLPPAEDNGVHYLKIPLNKI